MRCTGCAACVMACPQYVLGYTDDYYQARIGEPMAHNQCVIGDRGCDIYTGACRRFRDWESDLNKVLFGQSPAPDELHGHVRSILLVRITDKAIGLGGYDRGLVFTLLCWGLARERIDRRHLDLGDRQASSGPVRCRARTRDGTRRGPGHGRTP